MSWHFEIVVGPLGTITEGPAWDGEALLFSHIPENHILRYDPETSHCTVFREDTNRTNGLLFDSQGRLCACESGGRRMVRYEPDGAVTVLAERFEGKRLNSPNDVAIDKQGRVWFTDPRYGPNRADMEQDHESVYRLDPQPNGIWSLCRATYDTTRPNGILISPDQSTLYVAESNPDPGQKQELRAYPMMEGGRLRPYDVLYDFTPHRGIDGMCLDTKGNIIATAGSRDSGPGPMIRVFSPKGEVLEEHPLPEDLPTNCTFGDLDLRTLYVTTIGGHLLRARTERQGHLLYPELEQET